MLHATDLLWKIKGGRLKINHNNNYNINKASKLAQTAKLPT
jgi:hypothetical protein